MGVMYFILLLFLLAAGLIALLSLWVARSIEADHRAKGKTPTPSSGRGKPAEEEAVVLELRPEGAVLHLKGQRFVLKRGEAEGLLAQAQSLPPEKVSLLRKEMGLGEAVPLFLVPLAATQGLALFLPHPTSAISSPDSSARSQHVPSEMEEGSLGGEEEPKGEGEVGGAEAG